MSEFAREFHPSNALDSITVSDNIIEEHPDAPIVDAANSSTSQLQKI